MAKANATIDYWLPTGHLIVRASLKDSAGAKVTSGTCTLRVFQLEADGTYKQLDFDDDTFKSSALTTPTAALTHRAVAGYDLGVWTALLSVPAAAFSVGGVYLLQVAHAGASPAEQEREIVWGNQQSTLTQSGIQLSAMLEEGVIQIVRGDDNTIDVTGLGDLSGAADIWFTGKRKRSESDAQALVQVSLTGGLLRVEGAAPIAGQTGTLTTIADGVRVTISNAAAKELVPISEGVWDVQTEDAGGLIATPIEGVLKVKGDVTRAV